MVSRTILLVDDDDEFLEAQAELFSSRPGGMRLVTAANGEEARDLMAQESVDLLVTALEMPVMDGFELLVHTLERYPNMHLLILSDVDLPSLGMALDTPGKTEILKKPIAHDAILTRAQALFGENVRGHIRGLSLPGFLQLLHQERRSCRLDIRGSGRRGTLDLFGGEVMSASCGPLRGIEAIAHMLFWRYPDIGLSGTGSIRHREIDASMPQILMEAARFRDEADRDLVADLLWANPGPIPDASRIYLSNEMKARLEPSLHSMLSLTGAVGIALVDLEAGRCVLAESRHLATPFESLATRLSTLLRGRERLLAEGDSDANLEKLTIHLDHYVEILRTVRLTPAALFFLGERDRVDELEVHDALIELGLEITRLLGSQVREEVDAKRAARAAAAESSG